MGFTRRRFLAATAAGAAAAALPGTPAQAGRRSGASRSVNDDVRMAVIGFNGRGKEHITEFSKMKGVRLVALCDADSNVLAREAKALEGRGVVVETCADLRRIMDRKDIDAVSIATPNHWHALAGVWACQSGKDVYVEKPVSHNIWEGRQLVNAARKYDRMVQAGTQSRSSQAIPEAFAWIRAGNLGRIKVARGLCYKPRHSIGKVDSDQVVPANIDYDLWTGPAEMRPLHRKRLHYDWHWDFNTGNGDLGNQGIHQMDLCRWALGETGLAPAVGSVGGRFGYDDDGNTPNTQVVWFGYETPLIFEVRGLPRDRAAQSGKWDDHMDKLRGMSVGVAIECEGGHLAIGYDYGKAVAHDEDGAVVKEWKGTDNPFAKFIDGVRSRKRSDLGADIEEGHVSSSLCHMGNIACRVGRLVGRQEAAEKLRAVTHADTVGEAYQRFAAHMDANGVDLDKSRARMGAWLAFDPTAERFTESPEASALLSRAYRDGFVVPRIA
jgi:predicted dehydrogenase